MITFIDLYCGIGGFRLALERCGLNCVWACDIDKHACQVHRKHWNDNTLWKGDIKEVDLGQIPKFDILCAGFPCQSFSVAGRGRGFEDTRGTLFFDICRIAWYKKPSYLLLENVKGLLSNAEGQTFRRIIQILDVMGYDLQWQVLNSNSFNVPQNRQRVILIGHLREKSRPKIFPISQYNYQTKERSTTGLICLYNGYYQSYRIYSSKGFAPTLMTSGGGLHIPFIWDGQQARQLTPLECERIQGFPDNWTQYGLTEQGSKISMTDNQRYKMCGNAVTVNVIEAIGIEFMKCV